LIDSKAARLVSPLRKASRLKSNSLSRLVSSVSGENYESLKGKGPFLLLVPPFRSPVPEIARMS
jgi:hypothetical protein